MKQEVSVFWFRRDLRLDDNHGLYQALKSGYPVLGLFIFDLDILSKLENKSDKRVSFIYEQVIALQLKIKSIGGTLLIRFGLPIDVWAGLSEEFDIKAAFCNEDYEPYARKREQQILGFLKQFNAPFFGFKDQVIFSRSDILKSDGSPYTVFTPYSRQWKNKLFSSLTEEFPSDKIQNWASIKSDENFELKETGFTYIRSGVEQYQMNSSLIKNYSETRNYPYLQGTSRLSVHFRFGTISIRKHIKMALKFSSVWLNELIWREFFMMILYHFPRVEKECFRKEFEAINWRNNEEEFLLWCNGKTGYPLVDAGMRELNSTGFMHNRIRMITASFLCHHLLIDWRWGEAYFAEKLLDYELASNNGGWQWAAGSGTDAAPYFRIFNPMIQQEKFDPEKLYIRKWIPEFETENYPLPIIDHKTARDRSLKVYADALKKK